jgi:hypothetical protein
MHERIHSYSDRIHVAEDQSYTVHVIGRPHEDGTWEAWLRFDPDEGDGPALETDRETTQPNLKDLEYWATGLETAYLEGALARARRRASGAESSAGKPSLSGTHHDSTTATGVPHVRPRAVLDPFAVYAQGEEILREELSALDSGHLHNIIRAHGLVDEERAGTLPGDRGVLSEMIVAEVRARS